MSDIVAFLNARLDEDEAAAKLAQASDPAPWSSDVTASASTNERTGYGAGLVVAADDTALWDCEGSNTLCMTAPTAQHIARHDPARVLREVKAKREIVQFCNDDPPFIEGGYVYTDRVLRMLAGAYADHPDYDPSWAA